jgi:tyrosyl-tRNA synthetase
MPVTEIDALESELRDGVVHPNATKRRLAREVVGLYHDAQAAVAAEEAFDRVFKRGELPEDVPVARVAPSDPVHMPALLKSAGLAPTTSEARRLIDGGALRIDGEQSALGSGVYDLPWAEVVGRVVQLGKRRFARIEAE